MNGQTTISIPTVVISVIVLVVALAVVVMKIVKNKKDGKEDDISNYYSNIIVAIQRAIRLLAINMDSFDNRDDYTKVVVSTAIDYLKSDCVEFGIPSDLIRLMDTDTLTNIITELINDNYYECFDTLDQSIIEAHKDILDDEFVACKCGIPDCTCKEGECNCSERTDNDNKNEEKTFSENNEDASSKDIDSGNI